MRDATGRVIHRDDFLQIKEELVLVVKVTNMGRNSVVIATLEETPCISTLYSDGFNERIYLRRRRDLSLLPGQYDPIDLDFI